MERCTICGSEMPRNAQFCGACGRLVSTMRELPTSLIDYRTVEMQEEGGPTVVTRPSNPGLNSSIRGDVTLWRTWSDRDTPSHNLSPLADEEDDEEEEKRRHAFLPGLPLPGGLTKGSSVPAVQGTPQFGGVPMVQGNPVLPDATTAAQGLQNAASRVPSPFNPLSAPVTPSPSVPNSGPWPLHPSKPLPGSPPHINPVGKGSGSKGNPGTGNPGNSGCGLIMLIMAAVIVIIISALGGLFFGLPPAISLVGSNTVTYGEELQLHGNNFVPGSGITLSLDNSIPLFAMGSNADTAQRHVENARNTALSLLNEIVSSPTPIRADATGSFTITIPVSSSWSLGKHTIRATEVVSSRSTSLIFTIDTTAPKLVVKPATLDFGALEIGSKAILSVVVNNSGQQSLNWQASVGDATWLSLQPASGTVQGNDTPQFIYATGDASKLKVGTYKAALQINSNGGSTLVNVQLVVTPQSARPTAKLSVMPTTLDFGSLDRGTQITHTVTIGNTGTAALNWTVDNGTANWVKLNTLSQTIQPGAQPDTLNVTVDTTNLTAGTQNATLTINSNGGKAQVAITVVVNVPPCVLQAPTSTSLAFNTTMGSNPNAQSFTVGATGNCTGGVTITPTVAMSSGSGWLAVTPSQTTVSGGSTTFTVNVTSSALAPGSYSGSISLMAVSNGAAISGSPQVVSISLTVTEVPPVLEVSPGKLPISVTNGDSATTYSITVTNTGGAALKWKATLDAKAPTFVTLSFGTNTTLSAGASTTVTVKVNPYNQPVGNYQATITVTAVDPITGNSVTNSPATTSVSITITAPPALHLSTTSLTFTPGSCVYTDSGTVSITNSGGGTLNWNVGSPVYTSGSGWLTVTPSGNATLTFSVDGTKLPNGQTYSATVTITPSVGDAQTVSVSFTVAVCLQ